MEGCATLCDERVCGSSRPNKTRRKAEDKILRKEKAVPDDAYNMLRTGRQLGEDNRTIDRATHAKRAVNDQGVL